MNENWKNDPRVKKLNPQKLELLTELAAQMDSAPKNQWVNRLLSLNMEASKKGLSFSDEETELIVSIISKDMSAAELQKINTFKMISKRLAPK